MVSRLEGDKVIGIKQTIKAIKNCEVKTVYIAKDADEKLIRPVINLAEENALKIIYVPTMKELGHLCAIDVGASTVAILK
ncbi:50S ribosomal protein L7ae-like protein [Clostridium fermenticellae]|uniref:50S ribosomal protein L7ae-like protein n=1 Tax=Clostridium fermenticellae TaxID=2068654 RepID=A0A386H0M5_9CLOT|nr:ribosomal L7Ae/L30e/S12e/Gadd45 family protein [Clostridium fermenticellae]AYD39247.1 50S ribosomal protein L7ae-like protein [Clostridium fermenticellae]